MPARRASSTVAVVSSSDGAKPTGSGVPAGTPAEDRHPVDRELESSVAGVGLDRAEPDRAEVERLVAEAHARLVEGLGTVGVRPPALDGAELDRAPGDGVLSVRLESQVDRDLPHREW